MDDCKYWNIVNILIQLVSKVFISIVLIGGLLLGLALKRGLDSQHAIASFAIFKGETILIVS